MSQANKTMPDAKRALQEVFVDLYRKKPYEEISIKELCTGAHVARTTFYFHYQNLAELKEDIEDNLIDGLLHVADNVSGGDYTSMDFHEFVEDTLAYIADNRKYIQAFLVDQPSYSFRRRWIEEIENHLLLQYPHLKSRKNSALYLEGMATLILTVYSLWLQNPDTVDLSQADKDLEGIIKGLGLDRKV